MHSIYQVLTSYNCQTTIYTFVIARLSHYVDFILKLIESNIYILLKKINGTIVREREERWLAILLLKKSRAYDWVFVNESRKLMISGEELINLLLSLTFDPRRAF